MQNLPTFNQTQDFILESSALQNIYAQEFVACLKKVAATDKLGILIANTLKGKMGVRIAQQLLKAGFDTEIYFFADFVEEDCSFAIDLNRQNYRDISVSQIPSIKEKVLIDALSYSTNDLPGIVELYNSINALKAAVFAVNLPSGFPAEGPIPEDLNAIVCTDAFTTFFPILNFFYPESAQFVENFRVLLKHPVDFAQNTNWKLVEEEAVKALLKPRVKFQYKGSFGHALLVVGSENTMGAAILAAKGCVFAGTGLTTLSMLNSGLTALNSSLPEAMFLPRTDIANRLTDFSAIAVGCGLGVDFSTNLLLDMLTQKPLLIDADGLNILAEHKNLLKNIQTGSILTPHIKEFDRLFGVHASWWERVETARNKAIELQITIILKNQYSFIALPSGKICINQSGNPAMSSGGMGDVLSGIITGLWAQGYTSEQAAIIGCFIHGKAADKLAITKNSITASQIAEEIPAVLRELTTIDTGAL